MSTRCILIIAMLISLVACTMIGKSKHKAFKDTYVNLPNKESVSYLWVRIDTSLNILESNAVFSCGCNHLFRNWQPDFPPVDRIELKFKTKDKTMSVDMPSFPIRINTFIDTLKIVRGSYLSEVKLLNNQDTSYIKLRKKEFLNNQECLASLKSLKYYEDSSSANNFLEKVLEKDFVQIKLTKTYAKQ